MDKQNTCQNCGERGGEFRDPSKLYEHEAHCHSTTPTPPAGQVEAVARAIKELAREKGRKWVGDEAIEAMMDEVHWQACLETAAVALKASGAEHIAGLVGALEELLRVKWIKDTHGKCDDYLRRQPLAWEDAKKALEYLPPELRGK